MILNSFFTTGRSYQLQINKTSTGSELNYIYLLLKLHFKTHVSLFIGCSFGLLVFLVVRCVIIIFLKGSYTSNAQRHLCFTSPWSWPSSAMLKVSSSAPRAVVSASTPPRCCCCASSSATRVIKAALSASSFSAFNLELQNLLLTCDRRFKITTMKGMECEAKRSWLMVMKI